MVRIKSGLDFSNEDGDEIMKELMKKLGITEEDINAEEFDDDVDEGEEKQPYSAYKGR